MTWSLVHLYRRAYTTETQGYSSDAGSQSAPC